jgi:hypothetical protein
MWQPDFANIIQEELNPEEKIIWVGQPQQGFMLRSGDLLYIPFSILWGGFAIFWEYTALTATPLSFASLWGIPFVLMGLYLIFGRFMVDIIQRSRTYYVLTNSRAIIVSSLFNLNIKSLELVDLPEINITTKNNGKGTITFGSMPSMSWMTSGSGLPNSNKNNLPPSFEMIDDVRMVYQLIKTSKE